MKGTFTQLSLILVAVLFFSSCKREESLTVDQNRIYMEYDYSYDANSNKTIAQALFRQDGSNGRKVELTYPAAVRFNGEVLTWRRLSGDYQVVSYAAPMGGTFKYQDLDEKVYANDAKLMNSVELPNGLNSINKNSDFFLPWMGEEVQSGETIEVTVRGGASRTFRTNVVGNTYIMLDRNSLQTLTAGQGKIEIKRIKTDGLNQSTFSGGRMTSTYIGRTINITITE